MQQAGLADDDDEEIWVKEEDDEEEEDGYYMDPRSPAVWTPGGRAGGTSNRRRAREEKERTKMRERQRRAITGRILAGLRQHGNYRLRARADINEVIAALAREAGWVVLPDGTTFPSSSSFAAVAAQPPRPVMVAAASPSATPLALPASSALPLRGIAPVAARPISHRPAPAFALLLPPRAAAASRSPADDVPDGNSSHLLAVPVPVPMDPAAAEDVPVAKQLQVPDVSPRPPERDFAGTPYVPVYVMLPLGVVNGNGEVVDADELVGQLRVLKASGVDGVMVDCWWGNVEAHKPQEYNWTGYRRLFQMIRELKLKLQVYFDFMRSFRVEFDEYFEDGIISEIEIGLGACGELRYPSYPAKHGWKYPGIGEFQCYDRYLQKSLRKAAEARGHTIWARGPDNAGHYNSEPNLTGFFCDGGDYDSYYGRFFLSWYSQALVDHADRVLMLARLAFEGTNIAVKVSGVHWWYKTASHAAELTAGFYNPCNRDGYAPIAAVLKKYDAALNFTCVELRTMDQHEVYPEAFADPEGLVWQVLNAAWDAGIQVASENALPCYDRDGFNKILENAKPLNDPDGRHLLGFTYLRLGKDLFERPNFFEFERFIKRMHGEAVLDLQAVISADF
ncbi:Beta-amylase [Zea mays]|uniref:Beta-amylase n=1 Tax=Zea mays TaxID=4577 RepID=A0A1D6I089_MAIZE|nr:Beta-amylase [Zea mays]